MDALTKLMSQPALLFTYSSWGHGILYYRPAHGATESQNWRPNKLWITFWPIRRDIVKISGRRYDPHNVEIETFNLIQRSHWTPLFYPRGLIKSMVKIFLKVTGFNKQHLKKAGRYQLKWVYDNQSSQKYKQIKQNPSRKVSQPLELVLCLIWMCNVCESFSKLYLQKYTQTLSPCWKNKTQE